MATLADLELDPGIRLWIARIEQISPSFPDLASPDPAVQRIAARELSDALAVDFTLPVPDGVVIEDVELAGRHARRYRASAAVAGPQPTQLSLHGGGFYAGTPDELLNDRLLARRALESGLQVFSLDYRLAPEHPYPAPVQDAVAALDDLVARADELSVDVARLGLGGNSAGAAISASTALRLRDDDRPILRHLDLEVPPTAMHAVGRSSDDYAVGFGMDQLDLVIAMYAGLDGPADANISPLDVPDLSGLPPTLIFAAEHDGLRDAGIAFAERLREADVPVELVIGDGHLHGSPGLTASFPAARAWQQEHARLLAAAYS